MCASILTARDFCGLGRSAEGDVVVSVQQVEPSAQIIPARSDFVDCLVKGFAAFVVSWASMVLMVRPCRPWVHVREPTPKLRYQIFRAAIVPGYLLLSGR